MIDPISGPLGTLEYDHGDGISITGGFVYRGSDIPELYGKFVFGDLALRIAQTVTGRLDVVAVREALAEKWGRVDGVLHSIGFAPEACLGEDFMAPQWDDVAVALHVSAYSLKALAEAFVPLMSQGGSIVGLDFDNRVAWPAYNWMGVAKSALESVNRFVAREAGPAGVRSNLVAAGPIRTLAMSAIVGGALGAARLGRERPAARPDASLIGRRCPAGLRLPCCDTAASTARP